MPKKKPAVVHVGKKSSGKGLPDRLKQYQFKKGNIANPKGRPKGAKSISSSMRQLLHEPAELVPEVKTKAEELGLDPKKTTIGGVLSAVMAVEAINGSSAYMKELMERIEGKVIDRVAHMAVDRLSGLTEDELQKIVDEGGDESE